MTNDTADVSHGVDNSKIIALIEGLLKSLGVSYSSITPSEVAGSTIFSIVSTESPLLIGNHGETLQSLNHLVKLMFEDTLPKEVHFSIDVNGYQTRRIKSLEDQARLVAERARTFRYDIEMSPMSSYERMIIHSTLKAMPDIETSSQGEGTMRHIVVRYIDPSSAKAAEDKPATPEV